MASGGIVLRIPSARCRNDTASRSRAASSPRAGPAGKLRALDERGGGLVVGGPQPAARPFLPGLELGVPGRRRQALAEPDHGLPEPAAALPRFRDLLPPLEQPAAGA